MQAESTPITTSERFERSIVFRVARGYFIIAAGLAVLGVVGGVFVLLLGFVRLPISEPQAPPPLPPPPALDLGAVQRWMAEQEAAQAARHQQRANGSQRADSLPGRRDEAQAPSEPGSRDPLEVAIAELKALYPAPTYAWNDVLKTQCRTQTTYGCLSQETLLVRAGVSGIVQRVLGWVQAEERLGLVRLLVDVVKAAPPEGREKLLEPIMAVRRNNARERLELSASRDAQIERARETYERNVSAQHESKEQFRRNGLYALGGGLLLLILVSLFLAHFAIERHLRLLARLVESVQPSQEPARALPEVRVG